MRREEKTVFIIYDTTRIACTWQKFPCAPNKCHGKCDFRVEQLNDLSRVYNDRPTQKCFSISTEFKSIFCCIPQTTSIQYLYVKGWWQNCSKSFIFGISRWPNLERRKGSYILSRRHLCLNYVECDYHIFVRLSIWRRRKKMWRMIAVWREYVDVVKLIPTKWRHFFRFDFTDHVRGMHCLWIVHCLFSCNGLGSWANWAMCWRCCRRAQVDFMGASVLDVHHAPVIDVFSCSTMNLSGIIWGDQ